MFRMKDDKKAILYVSITVLSWSTVASAFKLALSGLTYYELLLIASITALIAFAIILTFRKRWFLLRSVSRRQWRMFAIAGTLNPAMYYLVLFKSYELLPAQIAQPINYMWPVVLSLMLAVFARQRIPAVKFVGMAISLAGVAVISIGPGQLTGTNLSALGIALGIGSAFVWATYWLINRMNAETDFPITQFSTANIKDTTIFWGKRMFLVGGKNADDSPNSKIWIIQEKDDAIFTSGNTAPMPTQGSTLFPYDQNIYMLTTSTENKNVLYISEKGNGVAWHLADSLQALPSSFNYRTNASIIVDEKNYIRIFGGTSERQTELTDVWRGRLNRLAIN
jgi:uncharacterized membrane protein